MAISHARSKRKPSGSRYKHSYKKRQHELARSPSLTKLEKLRKQKIRILANSHKMRLLSIDTANLYDPKTKKNSIVKIKTITENPANRHFVRRNIMTKGGIIDTEKGKARITSRPGQDGMVNAILVQ